MTSRRVLNIGSGNLAAARLHAAFTGEEWEHVRLDIDPSVEPDIVCSMIDMHGHVPDDSVDALWSSHNIEHLFEHEAPVAFAEFRRVLKPDGFALITCPDIEAIAELIAEGRFREVVYTSPAGPVRPIDMIYGFGAAIAAGNHFMAHRTGYTEATLGEAGVAAGFAEVRILKGEHFDLWGLFMREAVDHARLRRLFAPTQHAALVD